MKRLFSQLLDFLISAYQVGLSPFTGGHCRYFPSCSDYARQAIHMHNPWQACCLMVARVCRCRPGGPSGFDPVPTVQAMTSTRTKAHA